MAEDRQPGTPGRETMGTNISPSVVQRVVEGLSYVVTGVKPSTWMSPMQPLPPQQQQVEGRQFDYPVGYNLRTQPREGDGITFNQLRALADSYDLLRLVIETRKDQVEAYNWEIVPIKGKEQGKITEQHVAMVTEFMLHPSVEHDWSTWLRALLEDLFVLDAVAIYPRMENGGLVSLDLMDAATLKRVLSDEGRTPLPPSPAFQQILKGMPAVDYTADTIAYWMRNVRTNRVYGYSPVEQIIMTVNIALRKQVHQLQYFTEGNIPEAIMGVPESWSPEQIRKFQTYWDSILEGNTAQRRHMKFVAGDPSKMKETKPVDLKDQYDEWLARVVCFAFSMPPTPFIHQVNRATAESMAEQAKEEGVRPLLTWLRRKINLVLWKYTGMTDVEFRWNDEEVLDAKTEAEIDAIDIARGVISIDDRREKLGLEPLGVEAMIDSSGGPVPVRYFTTEALDAEDAAEEERLAQGIADGTLDATGAPKIAPSTSGEGEEKDKKKEEPKPGKTKEKV